MTKHTPQVGDTITTAEELDALPIGAILVAVESGSPAGLDVAVNWPGSWRTDGATWPVDPSIWLPLTILYLPGRPPRPERVVKAEALPLSTLDSILAHLMSDGTRNGLTHSDTLNRTFGRSARRLAQAGEVE